MLDPLITGLPFGPVLALVLGALLLFAGRRLFWFAIGAVGFLAGFWAADRLLGLEETWLLLGVGILLGIVGAVLAVLLQRLAIALAGFLVGGGAGAWVAVEVFAAPEAAQWVAFAVVGLLAAVVAAFLFEAALIVITALLGAALVAQALPLGTLASSVVLLVLTALGIVAQAFTRPDREGHRKRRRHRRGD